MCAALVLVGTLCAGYQYTDRPNQGNSQNIEFGPVRDSDSLAIIAQGKRAEGITRKISANETLPVSGKLSEEAHQAGDLYIRGLKCLNDDDLACARLYFQFGAERLPSGRCAIAMGDTFNPHRLKKRRIYGGVRPDINEARTWYERAQELFSSEAIQRLQELEAIDKGS